ncbi:MAG: YeeE/YedE family protein [Candidatus Omnitrophica bacterium]|nr:YeeE/YedE family protein [Candidatus Omnitrophota bacterium]
MMKWLTMDMWSPYVTGSLIGVLSWITFLISNKALGVSTAYVRTCGLIEKKLDNNVEKKNEYYRKYSPSIDWEWMLVAGLILGAFLSSKLSGVFALDWVPGRWEASFGNTPLLRWAAAFIGAIIMQVGARWAGGCTSGHGISGTLQLAVSSWIAVICFFITGVLTAHIIYALF